MLDTRPSKKQKELLSFIDTFIKTNGYGPSYREIMRALNYKSVSTVAIHVDGLVARGFLRKTTHSARSLEVVSAHDAPFTAPRSDNRHIVWLRGELAKRTSDPKLTKEAEIIKAALALLDQKEN